MVLSLSSCIYNITMFPQIAKRKKKQVQIPDKVYREWEEVSKELDHKAKLSLKKIPNPILHDFGKVCRIKSIPEFYANYFIVHAYKNPEPQLSQIFSEEIQNLLTHGSHFHKISQRIKAREDILNSIQDSLVVVEGFMLMNQGKNVPLTTKSTIQDIVKGCQSLQELKELEKKKTEELANRIIQLRANSIEIINQVESWRKYLDGLSKIETAVTRKIRVIYPHQAINCLILLFYDSNFIKSSALKSQITFGKDEDDPFLEKITKNKKGGQIQSFLSEVLKKDTFLYNGYVQKLREQIPSDQAEELREKELQKQREQQRKRAQRQKQQKEREDKIKAIRQQKERKEKERKDREDNSKVIKENEKEKKTRVHRYSSVKNIKNKVEEQAQRSMRNKTSRGPRSQTKIINIDALLQQGSRQPSKKEDLKIIGVYKKRKIQEKSSLHENSLLSQKDEDIKQQKKIWQKQIKQQQHQKEKIKKLLKQAEKKALVQTRQFQEKLKRYEEEVTNLRSRIDSAKKGKRIVASSERNRRISMRGKQSVVSVYGGSSMKEIPKGSEVGLLQSKLEEESRIKRNLQSQLKELGKEKAKLQRQLEKQSSRLSKESSVFQKKLQKYEQVINKLKGQSENNKKIIRQLENSKISQQKKDSQNLRMYAIKQKEEELKKRILQKIEIKEQKKQLKQSSLKVSRQKKEKSQLDRSHSNSLNDSLDKDLQIVKTKQTIEIVFQAPSRKRQPQKQESPNNDLIEAEHKLAKLEKERELLEKKLEMTSARKEDKRKLFQSKIAENQNKVDRFKEQLQKERERNSKLQENIRQMRKSINNQFQSRLNRQRVRFERQREELLRTIEREKEEKNSRDKVLEQQMKFLKEMEKKETELISLLERQKREKKLKQQMLLEEIENKEQLKNQMEIQEIKRAIEREVRRELLQSQSEGEQEIQFRQKKAKMEQQIETLKVQRDNQIHELDNQNQRLKQLITRIKGQEKELLEAIRENIDLQSQEDQESSFRNMTGSAVFRETKREQAQPANNDKLVEELRNKTMLQYRSQEKKRQHYSDIENSSSYKDKEKIQNIVQLYLKSPHQYPGETSTVLPQEQKKHIKEQLQAKAKLIQQFQDELFSVKDLPDYVPTLRNDAINNHLLNLRDAYQDYEADALRRQLFPPLQEEAYNEKDLSVESAQPPIVTLMDDIRAHENKHSSSRREDKKNFLSINRMRLMLLQENRKQKQRQIIQQESRKKIQRQLFDKNRKKRQDRLQRKKQKDEEEKLKKAQQLQKSIRERNSRVNERRQLIERASRSQSRSESKSSASEISKDSIHKKEKTLKTNSKKARSERGLSESQTERDKQIYSDSEKLRPSNSKRQILQSQKQKKSQVQAIKEEQIQQSMDQKQEQQAQKMERALLKSEIKSLQSEVRSYISGEQQFQVYQQFVNEDELDNYIQQLLELSSGELKNLNGNNSLKEDVLGYCTTTILVAKNRKGIELGIGIFHKEYQHGEYVCDYILSHKMSDFLNLIFNFSRFIYSADQTSNKVQFIFDLKFIEDQDTLLHFLQFEKKCRRLGQVYVKSKNSKERKYVLKRALFQQFEETQSIEAKGVEMKLRLLLFDTLMKETNEGFANSDKLNFTSLNLILAYYLSQNPEELNYFRSKAENELSYRQLLVTALLFHKKELSIKNITQSYLNKRETRNEVSKIAKQMDVADVQNIEEMKMVLTEKLPATIKRGILEVGVEQIKYLIYKPEEAVARVQSSNSSETGLFLSFIPKYKLMIIEAEEFLTMSQSNPDLTAFFYIKHFIKNIVDVKKQIYERVYLPEMAEQGTNLFTDAGQRLGGSLILEQTMKIGWKQTIGNSVIFTPKHRDLVIQKPFIVALLSGAVERAVQGSPLCVRIVQ